MLYFDIEFFNEENNSSIPEYGVINVEMSEFNYSGYFDGKELTSEEIDYICSNCSFYQNYNFTSDDWNNEELEAMLKEDKPEILDYFCDKAFDTHMLEVYNGMMFDYSAEALYLDYMYSGNFFEAVYNNFLENYDLY